MSYRDVLLTEEPGLKWSFACTISGIQEVYTDGVGNWGSAFGLRTVRDGCLYTRDFSFDLRSDPMRPLTTGGEVVVELGDDGSGEVFLTFAPDYAGSEDYVTSDVDVSGTVTMADGTMFSANDFVCLGNLETIRIAGTAPNYTPTRGWFETIPRKHKADGAEAIKATESPISFAGRYLVIYAAPVNSSTGWVDTVNMGRIWAGVVRSIRNMRSKVQVAAASLGTLLETSWPARMPSGQLRAEGSLKFVKKSTWNAGVTLEVDLTHSDTVTFVFPAYEYDPVSDSYEMLDNSDGTYPVQYLLRIIQDTINYAANNSTEVPFLVGSSRPLVNKIFLTLEESTNYYEVWCTNASGYWMSVKAFGFHFSAVRGRRRVWRTAKLRGLSKDDTVITVRLDHPSYPFELSYKDTYGAARISDGTDYEVVKFTGVETVDDFTIRLTGCVRGFGGQKARDWGIDKDENGDPKGAQITQLLFAHEESGMEPDHLFCALLLSAEDLYGQGSTDWWTGYRQCLGIPIEFVDVEGITRTLEHAGDERINSFWVDEPGGGKKSLEELCKFYGVFFVTRQFVRNSTTYFGLSLESISTPVRTFYQDTFDDSDVLAGSEPLADHNERLVVNVVAFKPFETVYAKSGDEAAPLYEYDEFSIARMGPQKTLEISPTLFDARADRTSAGRFQEGREGHISTAIWTAERWFTAFGKGNYKLAVSSPAPVGWRYYPGDHVLVSLTGVRSPQGGPNISEVPARIYTVMQRWGQRGGADLEMRLSFDSHCELAPSARVTAATATTITLDTNYFTKPGSRNPFTNEVVTDATFFDPAIYGDDIACEIWSQDDYEGTVQQFKITARTGNVLAVDTDLTATEPITRLNTARAIIGFQAYDNAGSTFQRAYAYIADNGNPPTLGTGGASAKMYG